MGLTASDVMKSDVRTVAPGMRVAELERVLLRVGIGGAPVVEGDRVVGIVSRSDLVRKLVLERSLAEELSEIYDPQDLDEMVTPEETQRIEDAIAARWQDARVEDVMIRDFVAVGPREPVEKLAQLMLDRRIHRILVLDAERLLGIVSSLDLVRLVAEGRAA